MRSSSSTTSPGRRAVTVSTRHTRQRGAMIIVMLIALLFVAAMVFYVFNLGHQTHRRVLTQTSTDNAATASAGWVARSMNTVAMNNVAITRYISTVNYLDSMPVAVRHTLIDETALLESLNWQIGRGISDPYARDGIEQVQRTVATEVPMLEQIDQLFAGQVDVTVLTMYDGPNGRGGLWRAMEAMDLLSQAEMQSVGAIAGIAAHRASTANHEDIGEAGEAVDGETLATQLAGVGDRYIPWVRGRFDDFRRPVIHGMLPVRIDDEVYHRGPWDTLFGWRIVPDASETVYIGGGGGGNVPIGSGGDGRWITRRTEPDRYYTYGPHTHMRYQAEHFNRNHLPYSRFVSGSLRRSGSTVLWLNTLSQTKLEYLWPGGGGRMLHVPRWETSFAQAVALSQAQPSPIVYTRFVAVEYKSRYPRDDRRFGTPGSLILRDSPTTQSPRVHYVRGWIDPRLWNATQINEYIWRDEWDDEVAEDPQIGITLRLDADGAPVMQPRYYINYFMFAGVDIGDEEIEIRNPHNFSSRADLPAPLDLDYAVLPNTLTPRPNAFRYFTYAKRTESTPFWQRQFSGAVNDRKPLPGPLAIAQANVFNNHSWDLWTQMWTAQLTPVDNLPNWIARLEDAGADQFVITQLQTLTPLSETMLQH